LKQKSEEAQVPGSKKNGKKQTSDPFVLSQPSASSSLSVPPGSFHLLKPSRAAAKPLPHDKFVTIFPSTDEGEQTSPFLNFLKKRVEIVIEDYPQLPDWKIYSLPIIFSVSCRFTPRR
jgi:hypothetical protein